MRTVRSIALWGPVLCALTLASCELPAGADDATAEVRADALEDGHPVALVTDPEALTYLERNGFGFEAWFAPGAQNGSELHASSARYRSLEETLRTDVLANAARYLRFNRVLQTFASERATGREAKGQVHGLNHHWLRSEALRFELVAVANRFDRRIAPDRHGPCGDVRLVYRAAYSSPRERSRLPLTTIVAFAQPDADCAQAAKRWVHPAAALPQGVALGQWLAQGPLRGLGLPQTLELNAQTDLWSRFVREHRGTGRHHQYSLRVFRFSADVTAPLEPVLLENTPDVAQFVGGHRYDPASGQDVAVSVTPAQSAARRAALLRWVRDNLDAIDDGTAALGPLEVDGEGARELRATQVDAFSAMGLTRAVNRPFSQVLGDDLPAVRAALAGEDLSTRRTFRSAEALLRRLDTMTCNGCHTTRSVVGFHVIGEERDHPAYRALIDDEAHATDQDVASVRDVYGRTVQRPPLSVRLTANFAAVGVSAHARDEQLRRERDLARFLNRGGGTVLMPPPDRGATLSGKLGAPCYLGALQPGGGRDERDRLGNAGFGFAAAPELHCRPSLTCVDVDGSDFGQCALDVSGRRAVGDPFERHRYQTGGDGTLAHANPFLEEGPVAASARCRDGGQTGRAQGFPLGGLCMPMTGNRRIQEGATGCGELTLGEAAYLDEEGRVVREPLGAKAGVACGPAPFLDRVASDWGYMSTAALVWNSTAPGLYRTCDVDNPCRDEYVCARNVPAAAPEQRDPTVGICVPGYLLPQLEIDAHKVPQAPPTCLRALGRQVVEAAPLADGRCPR